MPPLRRCLALMAMAMVMAMARDASAAAAGAQEADRERAEPIAASGAAVAPADPHRPAPASSIPVDAPGGPAALLARAWGAIPVDRLLGRGAGTGDSGGRVDSLQGPAGLGGQAEAHAAASAGRRPPPPGTQQQQQQQPSSLPAAEMVVALPGIASSAALQASLARVAGQAPRPPAPGTPPPSAARRPPPALPALEGRLPGGVGGGSALPQTAAGAAAPAEADKAAAAQPEPPAWEAGNWSASPPSASDPLFDPYGAAAAWEAAGDDINYDQEAAAYDEDGYDDGDDDFWDALYDDEAEMDALRPPGGDEGDNGFRGGGGVWDEL